MSDELQVTVPFLRTTFPELKELPDQKGHEILQKCVEADAMISLSKRYMLCSRVAWFCLLLSAIAVFVGSRLVPESWLPFRFAWAAIGAFILFGAGNFVSYHVKSSRELHRLVKHEIERVKYS